MLRRSLDYLYLGSGILGGFFLAMIGAVMLTQTVARIAGYQVRGADDLTAWSVAATAMLSLAYAFRHGAHIRVTVFLHTRVGNTRRVFEVLCLCVAAIMAALLSYALLLLVYDSWQYKEIAQGLIKIPIWIPQTSAGIGALIFLIAILDDLVAILRGQEPSYNRQHDGT